MYNYNPFNGSVVVDSTSIAVLESIVQPQEKDLDKEVKKTSKSGLDGYVGIEHYFKFGVQFTESLLTSEILHQITMNVGHCQMSM